MIKKLFNDPAFMLCVFGVCLSAGLVSLSWAHYEHVSGDKAWARVLVGASNNLWGSCWAFGCVRISKLAKQYGG